MEAIKQFAVTAVVSMSALFALNPVSAGHVVSGPGVECTDFSGYATGVQYSPGQSFNTNAGTVEVRPARTLDSTPIFNGAQFAEISQAQIAGAVPPEVHGYFVNLRVLPATPLSSVSMHFAQNTGKDNKYLYSTLAINGEVIQLANGVGSAKGVVLGGPQGQVLVTTTITHPTPPNVAQWISGTVTLTALTGTIDAFMIGGVQFKMDDLCFIQ